MARFLIVLGVVLFVSTFLLAFTIYGMIAGILGVVAVTAGLWLSARGRPHQASGA